MVSDLWEGDLTLTGNKRFRSGFGGTLVLQVEERVEEANEWGTDSYVRWRDARIEDLTHLADDIPGAP